MKRCFSLLVTTILAVPLFASVEGDWQGEVRISGTSGHSYLQIDNARAIAVDSNNVHIVWRAPAHTKTLRYAHFPISSPPAAPDTGLIIADNYDGTDAQAPMVACAGGKVHVDWFYSQAVPYIHFREYNGSSWGSIINHGRYNILDGKDPSIADDKQGNTHCVFCLRGSVLTPKSYYMFYQRRDAGASGFTSAVSIYNTGDPDRYIQYPSICVGDNGTIHVAALYDYSSNNYNLLYSYSTNNGASWNNYGLSNVLLPLGAYTSICCGKNNIPYIAFVSKDSPNQIFVTTFQGGALTTPVNISQSTGICYNPSICCDTFGNIWVAYQSYATGTSEVYYNVLDAETMTWSGSQIRTSPDAIHSFSPHIASDPYGNVHLCWLDRRDKDTSEVYYSWFRATPPLDAGVVSIDTPADTVWSARSYTPQATIKNFRDEPLTFHVVCDFDSSGVSIYSDTVTVTDLQYEETRQVTFSEWITGGADGIDYLMKVKTLVPNDVDTTNDVKSKNVRAMWIPPDVGSISLDVPGDTAYLGVTYAPKATVKNFNEYPALSFDVVCEFSSVEVTMYSDTVHVTNLDSMGTVQVTFENWTPTADLPYRMTVFTLCEGDRVSSNDSKSKVVLVVQPVRDVAVKNVISPPSQVTPGGTYVPGATVANFWSAPLSFDVVCDVYTSMDHVYSDTVAMTSLAGGSSEQVAFAPWTAGPTEGLEYTVTVSSLLDDDVDHSNDFFSKTVTTKEGAGGFDIAIQKILSPPDLVFAGSTHAPRAQVANLSDDPVSVDVICKFGLSSLTVYEDTVQVPALAPGEDREISFNNWTAGTTEGLEYDMTVSCFLEGDLNHANDICSKEITTIASLADLDIQDYAGNISANTMELTGFENSIVVGSYVIVNPDNEEKNVDLFDGPANVSLESLTFASTDLTTYDGRYSISASRIDPNLEGFSSLALGKAVKDIVQVYIPRKTKEETFTGTVSVTGSGQGSETADEFTLKLTIVHGKNSGPCAQGFFGESLVEGNQLCWSNFGFGEQGFNLYRAEPGSESFTKLNEGALNLNEYTDIDVEASKDYSYKLGLKMPDGKELTLGPLSITSSEEIGEPVLGVNSLSSRTEETEISYFLPKGTSSATLKVYDISGKLVKILASGSTTPGFHTAPWNRLDQSGRKITPGIYFCILSAGNKTKTQKMVIVN